MTLILTIRKIELKILGCKIRMEGLENLSITGVSKTKASGEIAGHLSDEFMCIMCMDIDC